jgi:hypothetical protein
LSVCMGSTWFNPTPGMSCLRECVYFSFSPGTKDLNWLVVSTPLKNMSQLSQLG